MKLDLESDLKAVKFKPDKLSKKSSCYPHPPVFKIETLADFCIVTNTIANIWREKAYDRLCLKEGFVGEIIPWFRGQSNAKHTLTPSLARFFVRYPKEYGNIRKVEEYLENRFTRFARPYLTGAMPADIIEWNYIMRHHEVPSRLLDWTKGSLIGLSYAVHDPYEKHKDKRFSASNTPSIHNNDDKQTSHSTYADNSSDDCAVWMLEPRRLMEITTSKIRKIDNECSWSGLAIETRDIATQNKKVMALRMRYFKERSLFRIRGENFIFSDDDNPSQLTFLPMPLIPSHISRRLETHLSRFTLHYLKSFEPTELHSEANSKEAIKVSPRPNVHDSSLYDFAENAFIKDDLWYLVKFIIPRDKRYEIARGLRMTGVSDMNFSQDLDGLASELQYRLDLGARDDQHFKNLRRTQF